ncbi:hypothetical protein N656DRAFT_561087 [Canariomyces notabilis]|uniref:Uncharacterized protein n=1 Tax=Canariomyces notabilis TaxID=2074819 RepID=A0AAN6QBD6_9PEZI|nr:hypothetical protein N656DRAFT_561087 [Canariomyces arenarius]
MPFPSVCQRHGDSRLEHASPTTSSSSALQRPRETQLSTSRCFTVAVASLFSHTFHLLRRLNYPESRTTPNVVYFFFFFFFFFFLKDQKSPIPIDFLPFRVLRRSFWPEREWNNDTDISLKSEVIQKGSYRLIVGCY